VHVGGGRGRIMVASSVVSLSTLGRHQPWHYLAYPGVSKRTNEGQEVMAVCGLSDLVHVLRS
jgi:hypothetical protein